MNPCRCGRYSACLVALAVAVVGHSLTHSFDHPHTHVPVAGEFATFANAAILASSTTTERPIVRVHNDRVDVKDGASLAHTTPVARKA